LKDPPLDVDLKLPRGTIVEICGPKIDYKGSKWYPYIPPEGEYRFVPLESVRFLNESETPPTRTVMMARPEQAPEPQSPRPSPIPETVPDHLRQRWAKAERAETEGNLEEAKNIYTELAHEFRRTGLNDEAAIASFNRIQHLIDQQRGNGSFVREPIKLPNGTLTSNPRQPVPTDRNDQQNPPPSLSGPMAPRRNPIDDPPLKTTSGLTASGVGYLRRATFTYEGRQVYALVTDRNALLLYATSDGQADLERYVGRRVELFGDRWYRPEMNRNFHMRVAKIVEVP
jgi:hypothetical protein